MSDHLSSNSIITDSSGNILELSDYEPYGNINYETGSSDNKYKFIDKEFDTENSLQYFGARYMDNEIGKFVSIDPILIKVDSVTKVLEDPQALNSYAYSRNNPIILVDPDGNLSIAFDQLPVFKHYARWVNNNAAKSSNIGVSVTPIAGEIQDAYEAISGTETFTGEQLSGGERAISGVAVALPFVGGAVVREGAQQIAKHADEVKTLYHGSVNNFTDIMKDGFSASKDLFVTDNILDAVKYSNKYPNPLDPGVVKIDVPKTFFDKVVKPLQDMRHSIHEYRIQDSNTIKNINSYIDKFKK